MWYIYDNKGEIRAEVHELEYEGIDGGARTVTCSINSPIPIKWNVTDSLNYRGETFYLRHIPSEKKQARIGTREEAFVYNDIAFYSAIDELASCDFLDVIKEDNNLHYSALPIFSFYCETIYDIADRLQANLDRLYTGVNKWTIQVNPDPSAKISIKPQALSFSSEKCSQVLERICNDLGVTYEHHNRTITFGAMPIVMPYEFKYGKGNGLKSIEQSGADDNALVTRARVYGSTRNLPHRYYNKLYKNKYTGKVMYFKKEEDKPDNFEESWQPLISETMYVPNLMLPMFRENGKDAYIDAPDAIAKYGLREGTKFFDSDNGEDEEIYPTIENMTADRLIELGYTPNLPENDNGNLDEIALVQEITHNGVIEEGENLKAEDSYFYVWLKDIGFDINDHLSASGTAKISFKSGALAGREFEIAKCEEQNLLYKQYKLTCKRVEDTTIQLVFPNTMYQPAVGDKFTLLEIDMPEVYIKVAELRLKEEGDKWVELNSNPIFAYTPEIDPINVLRNPQIAENLKEGRTLIFSDEDLGISITKRISNLKIKDNGVVPEYEVTLSEKHSTSLAEKVTQNVVNMIGTNNVSANNIKSLIDAYGNNLFLNKKKRDTADQVIRFAQGLEVGEGKATIDADGTLKSQEVISNNIHTTDFAQGALLGTGGAIYQLNGKTYAEFDYLTAREGATFAELIIQEYRSIGGALVISQANGEIERVYNYGNGYNIWLKDDDRGNSLFANNDLVRCQYWDKGKNELVYYWTPVSVSEDLQGRYVLTIYKKDMNGVVPQVGDKLVQMGNTTDTSRQGCILLTTENSMPRMAILDGINSPTLSNSNYKGIYGSLDGFTDPYTDKELSGYGMWGENVYLHGDLVVSSTKTTISSELEKINYNLTSTKALIDEDIREINNRLDGVVTNWFGDDVPRLDNHPAEQWTTEQEKMNHIGDTYTNTETTGDNAGRSWRWVQDNGEYKWIQIADSDAIKALEWASKAQSTADGKRRVFVNTPTTPYDEGDLWVKQEGEKTTLYYSIVDKAKGQPFAESDWLVGATDDTAIKDLQIGGTNLLVGTNQGVNNWSFSSSISTYTTKEISYNGASGVQIIKNNPLESAGWEIIKYPLRPELIKKDKKYHLTFDFMQSAENDTELGFSVSLNNTNGNNPLTNAVSLKSKNIGGIWQHFDVEFTAIANGNKNDGRIVYFNIQRSTNEWKDLAIANLKLEEGNKATTWSPSPEDAESALILLKTETTAKIEKLDDRITQSVNETIEYVDGTKEGLESKITTEVGKISQSVEETITDVNGVKTNLSRTGIDIEKNVISVSTKQFEVKNNNTGEVTASVDDQGRLSANVFIAKAGVPMTTINENKDGYARWYYPNTSNVAIEIGWDEAQSSLIRVYSKDGTPLWKLGTDQAFLEPDFQEWSEVKLRFISNDYQTAYNSIYNNKSNLTLNTYYQHNFVNKNSVVYANSGDENSKVNGWYTNMAEVMFADVPESGKYYRNIQHFTNGVLDDSVTIIFYA